MEKYILDTSKPMPRYIFLLAFPIGTFLVSNHLELVGILIAIVVSIYLLKKLGEMCIIEIQSKKYIS